MKAWRKEAAEVKKAAVKAGRHIKGTRYGRALRDAKRMQQRQAGMVGPLMAGLIVRHFMLDIMAYNDEYV